MFTSEPSLAQRIERMIGDVPIVAPRSELAAGQLHATDLAALIAESPVRLALGGVGMTPGALSLDQPVDRRVEAVLPFLQQIRTSAVAWCLFRIFRDLYDFDEPHLTLDNYRGLMDRVAQEALAPDRADRIIRGRARIGRVITPLPRDRGGAADEAGALIAHRFDIVASDPGDAPPEAVRARVFEQLDGQSEGSGRFAAFDDLPDLDNPVHAAVLAWHHLHEAPLQVVLDESTAIVDAMTRLLTLIERYPGVRFGLLTDSSDLAPRVAALAGRFPQVFAEGFAGTGVQPAAVEQNVLSRIQQAGGTKVGGFASGATSAEWIYGSLQATRKVTASALARAVAGGFFEEDEIPPLVRSIFAIAPNLWYRLDD